MRFTHKILMSAWVMAFMATAANAQTSGTVTVTGTTPESFAITNASDTALSSTITLGTLTPGTGTTSSALTTGTAPVRLRSNKAYKLSATAGALSVSGAGSAAGGSALTLSDIGFGIVSIANGGSGANVATGRSDSILSGYDVGSGWPAPTNGETPAFTKTLADITGGVELLSGSRISARGNLSTDNNFVTVTFGVATLPQFFTPNSGFSSVVTLTIASQ